MKIEQDWKTDEVTQYLTDFKIILTFLSNFQLDDSEFDTHTTVIVVEWVQSG